jgi:signal recognition particle subunit SEC65
MLNRPRSSGRAAAKRQEGQQVYNRKKRQFKRQRDLETVHERSPAYPRLRYDDQGLILTDQHADIVVHFKTFRHLERFSELQLQFDINHEVANHLSEQPCETVLLNFNHENRRKGFAKVKGGYIDYLPVRLQGTARVRRRSYLVLVYIVRSPNPDNASLLHSDSYFIPPILLHPCVSSRTVRLSRVTYHFTAIQPECLSLVHPCIRASGSFIWMWFS